MAKFLSLKQKKLLTKSFIESKFDYRPLKWMIWRRKTNTRINQIHERALRIVYRNNSLRFDELLKIDKSYNLHHKKIVTLAIEPYTVKTQFIKSNRARDF